jgi:hypothetical protein
MEREREKERENERERERDKLTNANKDKRLLSETAVNRKSSRLSKGVS